jgi:hypothetical protein
MAEENRKRVLSMRTILVETYETTLHTLRAADNPWTPSS